MDQPPQTLTRTSVEFATIPASSSLLLGENPVTAMLRASTLCPFLEIPFTSRSRRLRRQVCAELFSPRLAMKIRTDAFLGGEKVPASRVTG